ncbi:MAG: hypothetical protein LBJ75_02505 [Puniceicoccales bacterium]|jgi:hypothetical protein|nr:hypothetical protein [Puniceicoccales bacterium]
MKVPEIRMNTGIADDLTLLERLKHLTYNQLVDELQAAQHQGCLESCICHYLTTTSLTTGRPARKVYEIRCSLSGEQARRGEERDG